MSLFKELFVGDVKHQTGVKKQQEVLLNIAWAIHIIKTGFIAIIAVLGTASWESGAEKMD